MDLLSEATEMNINSGDAIELNGKNTIHAFSATVIERTQKSITLIFKPAVTVVWE